MIIRVCFIFIAAVCAWGVINITSACAWMMDLGKQKDKDKTWMLHCTSGSVNTAATQVVAESEYKWANRFLQCIVVKVLPFSVR